MTVMTMTREMGTLGKDVAAGVAEQLGMHVIHHEIVEHDVAARLNVGESDVHRFLEGAPGLFDRWKIDPKKLSNYTAEEMFDLASRGDAMIRGWGATSLLGAVPHIPRIRVCAPMQFRVAIIQERLGIEDPRVAQREIERNDAAHTRAMQGMRKRVNRESCLNYDLVLNTGRLPIEECIAQVVALASSKAFVEDDRTRQILADLALENRVHNTLSASKALGSAARNIDVTVAKGEVVLSGAVYSQETGDQLSHVLGALEGVQSVTNNLIVISSLDIAGKSRRLPSA